MPTSAPVSDFRLRELAEEPAEDLFPIMNSGLAFGPWFVVLAFLPPLAGVLNWTLDERTAAWGLRALAAVSGSDSGAAGNSLAGAPPLMTWLTAGLMATLGVPLPLGLTGISYLAAALTVIWGAKLARRLGVPRLAGLTVLCLAGSPLLLNGSHAGSPDVLGACLMTISLERYLAHLAAPSGRWSGRLFASGLAWGGCWLALGWPALCLGMALTIHALIFRQQPGSPPLPGEVSRAGRVPMDTFRRSLLPWWIVGLATGTWWLWGAVRRVGLTATAAWLFDPAPNAISPLYPHSELIGRWGATVGLAFLLGWIVLGLVAMLGHSPKIFLDAGDGRAIVIVLWWLSLLICRAVTAAAGADPTLWDVLQTVPTCLIAAWGMEAVIQRTISPTWLVLGVGCGVLSLAVHLPRVDSTALDAAVGLGATILAVPILVNLVEARSFHWHEPRLRRVLQGLLIAGWTAPLVWGVAQSMPRSAVDAQLAAQLARAASVLEQPGAVILVAPTSPPKLLEFLVRRQWPGTPVVTADRWESAVSRSLSAVDAWADSEFLVVELTRRDSQFRRPGTGWIITALGEPMRYYGDQLTFHRVSVQSP